ncbi:MAG: hypothetical protein ACRC35_07130 [Angustibacter sp.]
MRKLTAGFIAGILVTAGAVATSAPSAVASSGTCQVKVDRTGDGVKLELIGTGCYPTTLNVSTYQLPKTYDGSGKFNASAAPQDLVHNEVVTLSATQTMAIVPLTLPECGWFQWDVYTGDLVDPVLYPQGHGEGYIRGAIGNTGVECGTGTLSPTVTATESPTVSGTQTESPTETQTGYPTETETGYPTETPTQSATETPTVSGTSATSAPTPSETPVVLGTSATEVPAAAGLPRTGTDPRPYILGGVLLVLAGIGLAWFTRARRPRLH